MSSRIDWSRSARLAILLCAMVLSMALSATRHGEGQEQVIAAPLRHHGCDGCKYYVANLHLSAEERSASGTFIKHIQWKRTDSSVEVVPVYFSVEYCAGVGRTGSCVSYDGEVGLDGSLTPLNGSGGNPSWPWAECKEPDANGNNTVSVPIVQLDPTYSPALHNSTPCNSGVTTTPDCHIDGDISLVIAERVNHGQTYYFSRIRYWQHPDADSNGGTFIQVDMDNSSQNPICQSADIFTNMVRGWLDVKYYEFTSHGWPSSGNEIPCYVQAQDICFPYWFIRVP